MPRFLTPSGIPRSASRTSATGEVIVPPDSGPTVLDKTSITNQTLVTPVGADLLLISDNSDSNELKKVTVQSVVDLAGGSGGGAAAYDIFLLMGG